MSGRHRKSSSSGSAVYRAVDETSSWRSQELARAATALGASPSPKELLDVITKLDDTSYIASLSSEADPEEATLENSVATLVVLQVYSKLMLGMRDLALEAEDEAEWWAGIQRRQTGVAYFLLQTLPQRLMRLSNTILHTMQSHDPPLAISSLRPGLIRKLFPSTTKPSALVTALFPHLSDSAHATWYLQTPVQLVRGECTKNRVALEHMRDRYAEKFAKLHAVGSQIKEGGGALAMTMSIGVATPDGDGQRPSQLALMASLQHMQAILDPESVSSMTPSPTRGVFATARALLGQTLPAHQAHHRMTFGLLRRPSYLTLAWPKLIFGPPLFLIAVRAAYRSRETLWRTALEARETVKTFWQNYVIDPIIGILNTVRTGGDEGMRVISKEGMKSDLDSLERMVISLSTEKLSYTPDQIAELSKQIREGDLTEVMKLYEDDIKTPFKSAVTGTLIRTLLIQIQKTKVDIDFALTGIDKLLRSQELTFEFVGVAPALAVVYVFIGWVRTSLAGTRGRGRFGGRKQRARAYDAIRRIERLLLAPTASMRHPYPQANASYFPPSPPSPASEHTNAPDTGAHSDLEPLTSGLLLLALTRLRAFAGTYLPIGSRLRDGFLADVADLEDSRLGRAEKLRVVERMWRSWGDPEVLGWKRAGLDL
ncbi:nuclear control of ATPase protein 2 [Ceratobasidium sp. AG-Ba]|nr:nuclear control of ATPase protein 2 [Ceratobasidium sp. AG-Ba]